ncbi:YihY/virulence factor BrkB family protein [Rhodospirillaceae bacterium SYSU D60014]|uniref:YihY/virulence factor BrkB family protein n=1 Tax=Virgifigura deserti TaxID=2268457 RepID=UPI000E672219
MPNGSGRSKWKTSGPGKLARALWSAAYALAMGEGVHLAGHMAFTALLAIFPFLIFLAALAGVLGDADTANDFIDFMFRFMPDDVAKTLTRPVLEVLTTRSRGLLTFGILGTLWVASSGIEALRLGLNQAYGVPEARPLWYLRLQSIAFVILGSLAIFLLSLSIILGPIIWEFLTSIAHLTVGERVLWDIVRYLFSVGVLIVAVLILHRWLPNARQRWRDMLPGAIATTVIWVSAGSIFSLYLGNLGNYSITYGSLGGVIITLTFFYISALIFLFGAEFNVAFRRVFRSGRTEKS